MVIVDAFTHYVPLNPVPHCKAYFAYTTLYEHWLAKFGLTEILVTDNGTEFIENDLITICHLNNIKQKPRTSHGLSPYEMLFYQKPWKPIMLTTNSSTNTQSYCKPTKESICYNLHYIHTMKNLFVTRKFQN